MNRIRMEDLWEITFIEGSWKMDEEDITLAKLWKKHIQNLFSIVALWII